MALHFTIFRKYLVDVPRVTPLSLDHAGGTTVSTAIHTGREETMNASGPGTLESVKAVYINAPVSKVWKIHTDINQWKSWHPAVTAAALQGPLKAGSVFRWKSGGVPIVSTIEKVMENEAISWTGKAAGMHAHHTWYFKKKGNGTIVSTEETIKGWLVLILMLVKPKFLEKSLDQWLEHLKSKAESSR